MIRFDPAYTASFYNAYGAKESGRWQAGPRASMQHAIFCKHLRDHVQAGFRVLDVGCGPGTFAKVLLDLGAQVTCPDISEVQLQACRESAPGCEAYELGSVTDLSRFSDDAFDTTLTLGGVLSYCGDEAPMAIKELMRVTRPGGLVGLSVMNLYGTIHAFLPGVLAIPVATNRLIAQSGDLTREVNDGHECHMFRVDELRTLLAGGGLIDVELHASGWLVPDNEAAIPEAGSEDWQFLFEAEIEASRESPGAGTHIVAWCRVPV